MTKYPSPPRIHGNGFIQVNLNPRERLHLWDHRIPRQARDSSIHDHAFWFESECREGTLINVPMSYVADSRSIGFSPTHDLYRVVRVPNSEEDTLELLQAGVRFTSREAKVVNPGESYRFAAHKFHVSLHLGTTVTIMRRDPRYPGGGKARVACRVGEEPDNSWIRANHEIPEWAWDAIRRHGGTP